MTQSGAEFRKLSPDELEKLGQDSLRAHLLAQAEVAHQKHAPITFGKLDALLHDPDCLRFPVRLVYECGEMAMHQFAQPDVDWRSQNQGGRVLYLRPTLRDHPEKVVWAIAYMIPLINFENIITDEHCLTYGATLMGMMEDEFYRRICELADVTGAEVRFPGTDSSGCTR